MNCEDVMSQRIPGYSQPEMTAIWMNFVQQSFRRTGFKTTFNQKTRAVYQDGTRLLVLDEWHGDLEVLEFQQRGGDATHLGSQEIDVEYEMPRGGGKPLFKRAKLGKFKPGGKHKFVLTGSL
jgi:hypothetical protein